MSGGFGNTAEGEGAAVAGGTLNHAVATYTAVGGGFGRFAEDKHDWCAGSLVEDQ